MTYDRVWQFFRPTPQKLFWMVALGIAAVFLSSNILTPPVDEDLSLTAVSIETFSNFYNGWNTRIPGDLGTALYQQMPPLFYAIVHTAALLLFLFTVLYILRIITNTLKSASKSSKRGVEYRDSILLVALTGLMLFMIPDVNQVLFWRSGASNYFYPLLIGLLYSIPVVKLLAGVDVFKRVKRKSLRYTTIALYVVSGVVVGQGFENLAPVVIVFFVSAALFLLVRRKQVPVWLYAALAFLVVGLCLLLFSPGALARQEYYRDVFNNHNGFVGNAINNIWPVLTNFIKLMAVMVAVIVANMVIFRQKQLIKILLLCVVLSLVSVSIISAGVYMENRALSFGVFLLFIPLLLSLSLSITRGNVKTYVLLMVALTILAVPVLKNELEAKYQFYKEKTVYLQQASQEAMCKGSYLIKDNQFSHFNSPRFTYAGTVYANERDLSNFIASSYKQTYASNITCD